MPFTNAYKQIYLAQATIGEAVTPFNASNAHIGVGDGTTPFDANQTDLQGTNTLRKGMNPGYPSRTDNQVQFQSTFTETEANFAWNEFGVFNAPTGGVMLGREVVSLGTKASGTIWRFTVTVNWN